MHGFGGYPNNWKVVLAGAYLIHHPATGKMYVGSTNNLYRRRREHQSDLNLGNHHNGPLLAAFTESSEIEFYAIITEDGAGAQEIEQNFLIQYFGSDLLFNLSPDAEVAFKGLSHSIETKSKISFANSGRLKGIEKSSEHRRKMDIANKARLARPVSINGVAFSSVSDAARQLNMTVSFIVCRTISSLDKYKEWFYLSPPRYLGKR
jgi:hypothetical protein